MATQSYRVDVGVAQVIRGNEVILKCDIPSFAADFVSVSDWVDSEGISYQPSSSLGKILILDQAWIVFETKHKQGAFLAPMLPFSTSDN